MKRRRVFWALTALWVLFIWMQSILDAALSSAESGFLLGLVQQVLPWVTEHMLRKAAHFTEYAILGVLLGGAALGDKRHSAAFPPLFGLLTAMTDETIQLFSDGRSSQITDVWIDFAGFLTGYLIFRFLFRKKARTE